MKIIDLLVKIANGEEVPKKIRIDHWCYKFEWVEHLDNYYDKSADLDLMSVLSMSKEELNYELRIKLEDEIEIIEEENKSIGTPIFITKESTKDLEAVNSTLVSLRNTINNLVKAVNKLEEGKNR